MGNAEDLVERYRWAQRSRANEWGDPTYDLLLPLTAAVNDVLSGVDRQRVEGMLSPFEAGLALDVDALEAGVVVTLRDDPLRLYVRPADGALEVHPVIPCPRCGAPTAFGPAASTTNELARTVAVGRPVQAHETVCIRDR